MNARDSRVSLSVRKCLGHHPFSSTSVITRDRPETLCVLLILFGFMQSRSAASTHASSERRATRPMSLPESEGGRAPLRDDTRRSGLAESSPQIDVAARGILRLAPRLLTRGGVALAAKTKLLLKSLHKDIPGYRENRPRLH